MKQGPESHFERKAQRREVSVAENVVQVTLALRLINRELPGLEKRVVAYEEADAPTKSSAMHKWLEGSERGDSFSIRYRAYIEDPMHSGESVDLNDVDALDALIKEIKKQPLPTRH